MREWIGREEVTRDRLSDVAIAELAATLDTTGAHWPGAGVPPLFHWLHFLPHAPQSRLGPDGHPVAGGFMPPVDLPRRMWAGSRLLFHAEPARGAELERRSTITAVKEKTGASGRLVFVTVRHTVSADGTLVVEEEQDIVYRAAASGPAAAPVPAEAAEASERSRTVVPDPVLLFRYSALTFNAHRIHYDRDYATGVEGYSGLVVHGPLLATLLIDHALRAFPGRRPALFAFSARRPLFDDAPFDLCLADEGRRLWTRAPDGGATMTATLGWAD